VGDKKYVWRVSEEMPKRYTPMFIYWTRTLLGIILGILCGILRIGGWEGLSFTLVVYLISSYVYQHVLDMEKYGIKPSKINTIGIGAYFSTWITIWILLHTLFLPAS
jgi:hypothetical protein